MSMLMVVLAISVVLILYNIYFHDENTQGLLKFYNLIYYTILYFLLNIFMNLTIFLSASYVNFILLGINLLPIINFILMIVIAIVYLITNFGQKFLTPSEKISNDKEKFLQELENL